MKKNILILVTLWGCQTLFQSGKSSVCTIQPPPTWILGHTHTWPSCSVQKYDCPSSSIPCCPALTLLRPEHALYLLYIRHHAETWLCHNREQLRKHDCNLTDCFVAYFVSFWLWRASRILGFLNYARQCNMHDYASNPHCAPVLVYEQPYHAIAHRASAKKVCHTWTQYGELTLVKQTWLWVCPYCSLFILMP